MFLTPHMRRIADLMQHIHEAAEARSDNPFFWDYTPAELAELASDTSVPKPSVRSAPEL